MEEKKKITISKNNDTNNLDLRRWDYLDGYRGSLALIVVIIHSTKHNNCELANLTLGYSQSYSIAGFFMLSAFLLSYRLLKDFIKANGNLKRYLLFTLKYFIRRFFRIYLYYILFYAASKHGPFWIGGFSNYEVSLSEIMMLGNSGQNHLWSIPAEIKYYAFIPIYCLIICIFGRYSPFISIFSIIWTIYDQNYNFFSITTTDTSIQTKNTHHLKSHFAVFFLGSQVALAYYLIESSEFFQTILKLNLIKISINLISLAIGLFGLKRNLYVFYDSFAFKSKATLYWSTCLLLTLINQPNIISNFFGQSSFLKNFGRQSYSLYLWHASVINIVKKIGTTYQFENLILCVFFSYYVSYILYCIIEKPLIRIGNYFCSKLDSFKFFQNNKNSGDNTEMIMNQIVFS